MRIPSPRYRDGAHEGDFEDDSGLADLPLPAAARDTDCRRRQYRLDAYPCQDLTFYKGFYYMLIRDRHAAIVAGSPRP